MKRLLFARNNILVEETPTLPLNFGEIQSQKDLTKFKENLIDAFNDEDLEFIERTNSALNRMDHDDNEWLSPDQFLKELKTW